MKTTTIITEVIELFKKEATQTVMIGTPEATRSIQVQHLCSHARTMCMMYEATGDSKYLTQARIDIDTARHIKTGFLRPLGALTKKSA